MKKVLMILYWFPPAVGAAIKRGSKYCKYMNDFGYKPFIIAGEPTKGEVQDETLLNDFVNRDIEIHRVRKRDFSGVNNYDLKVNSYDKKKVKSFANFKAIVRNLIVPDKAVFWGIGSINKAKKIIKNEKIGIIYSSFAPGTAHVLGLMLKNWKKDLIWVADFRDSWMMDPTLKRRFINKIVNLPLEKSTLKKCDRAIFINSIIEQKYINKYSYLRGKTEVITNGFDLEDLVVVNEIEENSSTDKHVIIHAGTLSPSRVPDYLLRAILSYNEKNIKKVKFLSVGIFYSDMDDEVVQEMQKNDYLEIKPFVDKKELYKLYGNSEIVCVLINQSPGAEEIVTGKLFEAISLKKRLLLLGPEKGEAARIVNETKSGVVGDPLSVEKIEEAIKNAIDIDEPGYDAIEIKKYYSKKLTASLCSIFDELL